MASDRRLRDVLLVTLAVTTGATDAVAFVRLGHVFASVITGNLVLLGISGVRGDGPSALFAGCALAGYACGVFATGPRRPGKGDGRDRLWPASATIALAVDLALLIVFAVGWELTGDPPGRAAQTLLLTCAGAAMGVQSTAVRRLGGMSTTYLTSTLTGVVESLRARTWSSDETRSVAIICAAISGAAAGTALTLYARAWLPALQLAPLAVVIVASIGLVRRAPAKD